MLPEKQPIAGTEPAKKPTVAQTCNQLSLFLKQKGCLRDLHLGFNPKSDDTAASMTIDLLSNMENIPDQNNTHTEKLMNLPADSGRSAAASESKTAQMTIFYDGQVVVVDDIPADRARDVMSAAGAGPAAGDYPSSICKTEDGVKLTSNSTHTASNKRVDAKGLDLPIARRASLHKFLAKRKDRATVRAPYQMQDPSTAAGTSKHQHNFDLNI